MNIASIAYNFLPLKPVQQNKSDAKYYFSIPKYSHQLDTDVVSFTGKNDNKPHNKATIYTLGDKVTIDYAAKRKTLLTLGNRFMATLSILEKELKPYGVTFDYDYCKESIIKSPDSYISKFIRSGEVPLDQIRATLFMKNPYDLKILNDKIIPMLADAGYEIKENKSGPDLDIRLSNLNEKHAKQLSEKYQQCLGKPQKSGYEDIQLRLIDTMAKKKDRVPIELLIVFGKNYANAKHDESYYVYDITRALENLLNITRVENPHENSPEKRVAEHISNIKRILNTNISIPLFANAKSKDYYHERPKLVAELSDTQSATLRRLIGSIGYKTRLYYDNKIAKVSSDKYRSEIVGQIKHTSEYLERSNKKISEKEITARQNAIIENITQQKINDLRVIRKAKERMDETIEKYCPSSSLPKL